jgi:hypothetical protein
MQFRGAMAGVPVKVLADTGADTCFISAAFAHQHNLKVTPKKETVTLGNNLEANISGEYTGKIFLSGSCCGQVTFKVIDTLLTPFEVILGSDWMARWKVRMDFQDRTMLVRRGPRFVLLKPMQPPLKKAKETRLLSAMQVKRALRKGERVFLAVLTKESEDDPLMQHPAEAQGLLREFGDVFEPPPDGLPPDRGVGHTIPLEPGHTPPFKGLYRLSPAELDEAKRQIDEYLRKGWIEPSSSPYGAPILFVTKKDGGLRMCIDYRALNKITVKNRYPLPRIEDLFDRLQGARYFSSLDLSQGYHQIRITDEDVPKTAFRTPFGHYQFRVLSFGLTNAPATFQCAMNAVFGKIPYALVYLDDILIFSNTAEEHAQHLKEVLSILREEKLYAKMSKCRFFQTELEYLGHLVGRDGVRVDPRKVDSVMQWPVPKDVHQIRAFLGLANYFRRFMQGYSTMVAPLTSLTKKDMVWDWSPECQRAFEMVKQALTNAPVLALPDPDADWEVVCDASLEGIGCVAMQNRRPVAYESRKFSPAERRYHTTDQELAAVVHALKTWRCYLEGAKGKVTVVTDHNPLTFFKTQPNLSRRQARWSEYLSRFHFEWEYRPGRINVADPLSRFPVHAEQEAVLGAFQLASLRMAAVGTAPAQPLDTFAGFLQRIRIGYFDDPWFLDERNVKKHGLEQQNGLYWHGDQVAVPKSLDLREQLMREYHDVPTSGHMGVQKTGQALSRHYWWPGWSAAVRDYCAMCDACQRNKPRNKRPAGLLQPLQMPDNCWKSVSMDFIVSLPLTLNKHDAIMVMVDRFSKMVHFAPTTTDVTAEGAARIFLERVISQHGLPLEIVSDRDPTFASRF